MSKEELKNLTPEQVNAKIKELVEQIKNEKDPKKLNTINRDLKDLRNEMELRAIAEKIDELKKEKEELLKIPEEKMSNNKKDKLRKISRKLKDLHAKRKSIAQKQSQENSQENGDKEEAPNTENQDKKPQTNSNPKNEKKDRKPEKTKQVSDEEIVKLQKDIQKLEDEKNLLYSQFYTSDSKEIKEIEQKLGKLYGKMAKLNTESKSDKNDNKEKSKEKPKERLKLEQWKLKTELEEKIAIEKQKMTELYYQGYNDSSKEIKDIQAKIKELYARMPKPKINKENKENKEVALTPEQWKLKTELEEKIAIENQKMTELYYQGYNDSSKEIKEIQLKIKELCAQIPVDKEQKPKMTPEQMKIQAEIDKLEEEKALLYSQFYTDGSQEIKDIQAKIDELYMEMKNPSKKEPQSNPTPKPNSNPNPTPEQNPKPNPAPEQSPNPNPAPEQSPNPNPTPESNPLPIIPRESRMKKIGKGFLNFFSKIGKVLAKMYHATIGKTRLAKWISNRYINRKGDFPRMPWEKHPELSSEDIEIDDEEIKEDVTEILESTQEEPTTSQQTEKPIRGNVQDPDKTHAVFSSLMNAKESGAGKGNEGMTVGEDAGKAGETSDVEKNKKQGTESKTNPYEGYEFIGISKSIMKKVQAGKVLKHSQPITAKVDGKEVEMWVNPDGTLTGQPTERNEGMAEPKTIDATVNENGRVVEDDGMDR